MVDDVGLWIVVPKCISQVQNDMLMKLVIVEEVKCALFYLGGDKAPRSYGLPIVFFPKIWDIIVDDL